MAVENEDERLQVWMRLQVTRAQQQLDAELQAIDRRAAANRTYKGGGRVAEAIRAISGAIIPLAERIYSQVPDGSGRAAIHNYFCELNDRAVGIAKSAGAKISPETGLPDATMRAAVDLLDRIRDDLEMQWQIVHRASGASPSSAPSLDKSKSTGGKKVTSVRLLIERAFGGQTPIQSAETIASHLWPLFKEHSDLTPPASEAALIRMLRRMGY